MGTERPARLDERTANTRVTLVQATNGTGATPASTLLRTRLRTVALLILVALMLWLLRGPFIAGQAYSGVQLATIGALATATALLWSRIVFSRLWLRVAEGAVFLLTTGGISAHAYLLVRDRALAGNQLLVQGQLYALVIATSALVVAHGMLLPKTWRSTLAFTIPMAAIPLATLAMMSRLEPAAFVTVRSILSFETVTDLGMVLVASLAGGATGTQIIYSLRRAATAARDLGQYQLQERIASGGMGEIWRASHRFLARPAAIKVIHPDKVSPLGGDSAAKVLERFEKEAQTTARLESLNTVRIYDFGRTDSGEFYYAMELLEGLDLELMVERYGPVSPGRAIHFMTQACDSLSEAHSLGQVHRDVKPSNLFVCKVGLTYDVLKVLDFGLVTRAGSEKARDLRLEGSEGLAGTPAYMAPEQVLADTTIDERADIYALGCVGYWLLSGHTVFDIDRPLAMAVAHVKAPPMSLSRRTEIAVPADLEALIMQCLEKDPAARPQSAEALADQLTACGDATGWLPPQAREWWRRHRPLEGDPGT